MTRVVIASPAFVRAVKRRSRTDPGAMAAVRVTPGRLAADAFEPRLYTHKLWGNRSGSWGCTAGYDLRIVFELVPHDGAEAILLQSVGTHDEVY